METVDLRTIKFNAQFMKIAQHLESKERGVRVLSTRKIDSFLDWYNDSRRHLKSNARADQFSKTEILSKGELVYEYIFKRIDRR